MFLVLSLFVKVVVGVLGKLPLVALVSQIRSAACEVDVELLDVDLHDAAVNRHSHLRGRERIYFVSENKYKINQLP